MKAKVLYKGLYLAIALAVLFSLALAIVPTQTARAESTVYVTILDPSWTAAGGGGVYSVYYGPPAYGAVSPGTTAVYNGHGAAPIYAGVTIDPINHDYEDQGLLAFKPGDTPITAFATQTLTYAFENQYGTAPVWVYMELNKGIAGDIMYQYVPTSNPSYHTEDAATGTHWQAWTDLVSGIPTGPMLSLADIAAADPTKTVSRVYLTEGMGDSYHSTDHGTVAWVDKVTIGAVTYDFVVPSTVSATNLQPSWTATGGGGVYSVYYGPPDYGAVSPGSTAVYNGHEAAPIYAGVTIDPINHDYEDQGLFAFKPGDIPIGAFATQTLTYAFENQYGTAPVWVYMELNKGVAGDIMYQYVPTSNPSYHTEDAATGTHWQAWTDLVSGIPTGPMLSLADIAAADPTKTVSRVYLTEGMGDSYHSTDHGTVAWVDKVTIGAVTYDFVITPAGPAEETGNTSKCFIATAAYGSSLDSHVDTLRSFRDQYLETNPLGSAFVSLYYKVSPPMAAFIDEHPTLKPIVRAGLWPSVAMSSVALSTTLAEKAVILVAMALFTAALIMWLRRRARRLERR